MILFTLSEMPREGGELPTWKWGGWFVTVARPHLSIGACSSHSGCRGGRGLCVRFKFAFSKEEVGAWVKAMAGLIQKVLTARKARCPHPGLSVTHLHSQLTVSL